MNVRRAREEIAGARHLFDGGYYGPAVSRAYYGAFRAAEAALLALSETRSKHSGVISAFNRRLVREEGIEQDAARLLTELFDRRNRADYGPVPPPPDEAQRAIEDAERVVAAVERWLASRGEAHE